MTSFQVPRTGKKISDGFSGFANKKTEDVGTFGSIINLGKKTADQFKELAGNAVQKVGKVGKDVFSAVKQNFQEAPIGKLVKGDVRGAAKAFTDEVARIGSNPERLATDFGPSALAGPLKAVGTKVAPKVFTGFKDLSTRILRDLEGKATVSKQYILDATNRPELKQVERELIRNVLESEGPTVSVRKFADKVKKELLPLKTRNPKEYEIEEGVTAEGGRYENIALPEELRGPVADYRERIYESPIETSAGNVHFRGASENYFGHTRIEDLAATSMDDGRMGELRRKSIKQTLTDAEADEFYRLKEASDATGTTRRVIEVQSDLYQKGNLEKETSNRAEQELNIKISNLRSDIRSAEKGVLGNMDIPRAKKELAELERKAKFERDNLPKRQGEIAKLSQYNDPTAHFRMIREEVKQAAKDGKTKLQFPTGETAMKIEGLGDNTIWKDGADELLTPEKLSVGEDIFQEGDHWLITEVLGDGKFKAINATNFPEAVYAVRPDDFHKPARGSDDWHSYQGAKRDVENFSEEFDISGKVDTNNPIYKFYEKEVGRYLKNKYNAQLITDPQGVKWWELDVKPEQADMPVEAFGRARIDALLAMGAGMAGIAGTAGVLGKFSKSEFEVLKQKVNEGAAQEIAPKEQVDIDPQPLKVGNIVHKALPVPEPIAPAIQATYDAHTELPRGIIEAVLMTESEMGNNKNADNIGEIKRSAKEELERIGLAPDLGTDAGTIKAVGDYLAHRMDVLGITDPIDLYMRGYYGRPQDQAVETVFRHYFDVYSAQ